MEYLSLDLWAANLEARPPDLETWLAGVDGRLATAAAGGAQVLVMPEFACAQWLAFAPADLAAGNQLAWLADVAAAAVPRLAALSARHGVALLPGTFPLPPEDAAPAEFVNRALFLTPEGEVFYQDKLSLTPLEEGGASGRTRRGDRINVIHWRGLRLAIAICLDAEFTDLWSRLGTLDLDLVLVPAKTDMITGYNRVFGCARSRAVELQTCVCAVGAVGEPLGQPLADTGVGGASAFLPCDVALSPMTDGVFATLPPQAALAGTDPVLPVRNLPVGLCRRLRNGGAEAEVNPAGWSADAISINEPEAAAAGAAPAMA